MTKKKSVDKIVTLEEIAKSVDVLEKTIKKLDQDLIVKRINDYFASIQDDSKHLHEMLGLLIDKVTLCTELSFYGRQKQNSDVSVAMNSSVIWALDQPADWWEKLDLKDASLKTLALYVVTAHKDWVDQRNANRMAS